MMLKVMDQKIKLPTGNQIKAARCLLNITQEQCAKYTGVSLSTLKKYEQLSNDEFVLEYLKYDKVLKIVTYFESVDVKFELAEDHISVSLLKSI
jgi:transcriptional regulator with XRE-family HTH domain